MALRSNYQRWEHKHTNTLGGVGTQEARKKAAKSGFTSLTAPLEYTRRWQQMNKLNIKNIIHKPGKTKQNWKFSTRYTVFNMITMYTKGIEAQSTSEAG